MFVWGCEIHHNSLGNRALNPGSPHDVYPDSKIHLKDNRIWSNYAHPINPNPVHRQASYLVDQGGNRFRGEPWDLSQYQ